MLQPPSTTKSDQSAAVLLPGHRAYGRHTTAQPLQYAARTPLDFVHNVVYVHTRPQLSVLSGSHSVKGDGILFWVLWKPGTLPAR